MKHEIYLFSSTHLSYTSSGRSLLLTFDDGFFSNKLVAERILNPMGIKAIFFVISEFSKISDHEQASSFISSRIFPDSNHPNLPRHLLNMTLSDLEYLAQTGHCIGAHTATHARLSAISEHAILKNEIIESADSLSNALGIPIEHFAYTFGNLESFSPAALKLAQSRFKFIHTGLRGNNSSPPKQWAIRRDAIQPVDSVYLLGSMLEGGADRKYARSLEVYDKWVEENR